jgi:hypothetical protein
MKFLNQAQEQLLQNWDSLPDFMRVGSPVAQAVTGLDGSTFKRRLRSGLLPKPHKDGRLNFWLVGELRESIKHKAGASK